MPVPSEWSKDRIEQALGANSFGYQNVPLPHGLATGGDDRSGTASAIFSEDVKGQSVFDLGCRFGYFCFFAEERGAARIRGVDIDPENVRKSRLLAEMKGSAAEFGRFDIERDALDERFDVVLCLNVLHHLRNPLSALDKLIAATGRRLVLETAGFAHRDRRKNGVALWMSALLARLPLLYVAPDSTGTFFITTEAIRVLLLEKRADFARVDLIPAGPKGRPIVIAHRRRIGHLVIVAGMLASGKSVFIDFLLSEGGGDMARTVGFDPAARWTVLQFGKLGDNTEPDLGDVVIHYNIAKHFIDGDLYQHGNALSDLIAVARKVTVVTLACPRERLLRQYDEGLAGKSRGAPGTRRRKKIAKLRDLYASRESLDEMYADWFSFLRQTNLDAFLVRHDGGAYTVDRGDTLAGY